MNPFIGLTSLEAGTAVVVEDNRIGRAERSAEVGEEVVHMVSGNELAADYRRQRPADCSCIQDVEER